MKICQNSKSLITVYSKLKISYITFLIEFQKTLNKPINNFINLRLRKIYPKSFYMMLKL